MKRIMVRRGLKAIQALMALIATLYGVDATAEMPVAHSPQLYSATATTQSNVSWHEDFDLGWRAAQKSGRPMVIFITSKRCHYCDAMKRDTWRDRGILQRVKDKFVAIRLSPERNAKVLERIEVPAYPATLIGHPDGKILAHKFGYQPPTEMHRLLETADHPLH